MCVSASISRSGFSLAAPASPGCTAEGLSESCLQTPSQLAAVAKGLGHPTRVAILRLIATDRDRRTTGDIVAETGLAQSTVSEHLRVLARPDWC